MLNLILICYLQNGHDDTKKTASSKIQIKCILCLGAQFFSLIKCIRDNNFSQIKSTSEILLSFLLTHSFEINIKGYREYLLTRIRIFKIINLQHFRTTLLETCFNDQDFNYMSIFGFLEQQHIEYCALILLQDIMLPYIRKNSYKIMQIISKDQHIKQLLLNRIYEKPIFKIMYTVVYCLSKKHSQMYNHDIRYIVRQLINTPFTYLLYKQSKSKIKAESIESIESIKPASLNEIKLEKFDYNRNVLQLQIKPVRDKFFNQQSMCSSDSLKSPRQSRSPRLNRKKTSNQSIKSQSQTKNINKKLTFTESSSLRMNQVRCSIQQRSQQKSSQNCKQQSHSHVLLQIPLNEDLDYSDLTHNMKQLFIDISFNIKVVHIQNVLILVQEFNQKYITSLLNNCFKLKSEEQYQGYCQGAICIFQQFMELYRVVYQYEKVLQQHLIRSSEKINHGQIMNGNSHKNQKIFSLKILIQKLQKQLKIIAKQIPILCQCLLKHTESTWICSSGQKIKKIGLVKYRMLQLIYQLLQLNHFNTEKNSENNCNESNITTNNNNSQTANSFSVSSFHSISLDLQIQFASFDLLLIIQKYLLSLKWNNLMHCLLMKLVAIYLQSDYENFKQRYITSPKSPKDLLFGTLIQLFRNKKYIFLRYMRFINYGNIHAVYSIAKLIVMDIKKNGDYQLLIGKFPSFDQFVKKDLIQYEKTITTSQYLDVKYSQLRQSNLRSNYIGYEDQNGIENRGVGQQYYNENGVLVQKQLLSPTVVWKNKQNCDPSLGIIVDNQEKY